MDMSKISGLGKMKGMSPDIGSLMGGMSMPECKRTKEYGTHRENEEFDAIHDNELSEMEIDSMSVMCAAILDGIVVTYADGTTVKHGGNGGGEHKIPLQGDSIQRVTGLYNVNFAGHKVISQLRVETKNGKKYGPFGDDTNGSPFALEGDNEKIVAFFGSMNGPYIGSLGGYLMK